MSDKNRIYMYPKTSCNCFQCTNEDHQHSSGVPTNLAVRDCHISSSYECRNRRVVGSHESVVKKTGMTPINPQAYHNQYATNFDKIRCNDTRPPTQYSSWDPRLYSASHNQYITFDNPPLDSTVKLNEVYDKKLEGYGKGYRTYSDINSGNILYYNNASREDPYYSPLFTESANVETVVYKDPMGGMRTEYPRTVVQSKLVGDNNCDNDGFCLSWMRDSTRHREDILTGQMAKINSQRWMPRWVNNNL